MSTEILVGILIYSMVCGGSCSFLAAEKNRDQTGWFLCGFLLGIIGVLTAVGVPKLEKINIIIERKCFYCAEIIKYDAIICKHCGKEVPPDEIVKSEEPVNVNEKVKKHKERKVKFKINFVTIYFLVLIVVFIIVLVFHYLK